jgi:hypothetical protein
MDPMSEYTKLFERAGARYEPPDLPMEDFLKRQDRKRRNQRIVAGSVGIAVFVAAVWIVTTGEPFDRTQTPAASGPTVPPSARVGFIGLPPEGATPSTPERGELVLSLWGSAGAGRSKVWVYSDGRLIWLREADLPEGANGRSTGLLEQRLTPEGVDLLRSEIISTGRFGHDLDLADRRIIDANPADPLGRLVARLTDPVSWLPASAWEDREIRAYVPSRYAACYEGWLQPIEPGRILNLLPAPAEELLRAKERTRIGGPGVYCSDVTTEEARALAEAFNDAGFEQGDVWRLEYESPPGPESGIGVYIYFEPYLPHGKVTCSPCG